MCTTFSYKQNSNIYFGRNMDIDISFGEKVVIVPKNMERIYKNGKIIYSKFGLLGVASVVDGVALFAEAMNEMGLYMAGLNYPNNAYYGEIIDNRINLAPYELIPYILSTSKNFDDAVIKIQKINLIDVSFKAGLPLAPMHFFLSDGCKSLVIEPDKNGLHIYDNPVGVLTNNPPFSYHLYNLENYAHLSISNIDNHNYGDYNINHYGQGLGMIGLPGDVSPASRFIRTTFYKKHLELLPFTINPISDVFHVLENVAMIEGSVFTDSGRWDITRYSVCYDVSNKCVYVKTYNFLQTFVYSFSLANNGIMIYDLNDFEHIAKNI